MSFFKEKNLLYFNIFNVAYARYILKLSLPYRIHRYYLDG